MTKIDRLSTGSPVSASKKCLEHFVGPHSNARTIQSGEDTTQRVDVLRLDEVCRELVV